MVRISRRKTWPLQAGELRIGGEAPLLVQSMCATRTQDIKATLNQIALLSEHGAGLVRVAVDSEADAAALKEIRRQTGTPLAVDLQENYRLASLVAPHVQKIRYNPGHLFHHEKEKSTFDKVRFIVEAARQHGCLIRIGINFGSLDPAQKGLAVTPMETALQSAGEHIEIMRGLDFRNFVVSLKSARPAEVIEINRRFADQFPNIPLHLGVTEAGLLPMGEVKSRVALENLLALGIGDTLRVSLTLPFEKKYEEVLLARRIIEDVYAGRFRSVPNFVQAGLNIISCPSCSRVENEKFVELAQRVREVCSFAQKEDITIAVMGCRVNGPGETDDADLGLWCAPRHVNLKHKGRLLGAFSYEQVLDRLKLELEALIAARRTDRES